MNYQKLWTRNLTPTKTFVSKKFCFVWCLTSQSTAMVMSGQSVHLTTLFFYQYLMHMLLHVTDKNPSWISGREENGRRNYFKINLHKVWDLRPGSNSRPLYLQSDMYLQLDTLPTELRGPALPRKENHLKKKKSTSWVWEQQQKILGEFDFFYISLYPPKTASFH